MLGAESSGKTSLFQRLVMKEVKEISSSKTVGFNFEYFTMHEKNLGVIDMGGSDLVRELWDEMYNYVQFDIVFFVLKYNKMLFQANSSGETLLNESTNIFDEAKSNITIEGDNALINQEKKKFYKSIHDIKILMNEDCLVDCQFIIIVNVWYVSFRSNLIVGKMMRM